MSTLASVADGPFLGYLRADGKVGIRNHVAILYTVMCAELVARRISALCPGSQVFGIPEGCHFHQARTDKAIALGSHPNVAAVLVIGLGCEETLAEQVASGIARSGKPVDTLVIQDVGGSLRAVEVGARKANALLTATARSERVEIGPADLIVGGQCGGSDATSGLVSNPAIGVVADMVVQAGGTFVVGEVGELLGCEEIMARRSVDKLVADDIRKTILDIEAECEAQGQFSIGHGNAEGGLTTILEKSAGALAKAGSAPLRGVLHSFEPPTGKGLYVQAAVSGTGEAGHMQGRTDMVACGVHAVLFSTGRGATRGTVVAPTIKVCGNALTCERLHDHIDVDVSDALVGSATVRQMGEKVYREVLHVAAGKPTCAEVLGHEEE